MLPGMDVRDWVRELADSDIAGADSAVEVLRRFDPERNWSISHEDGQWFLLIGDQWVLRSSDRTEFDELTVGAAVATALARYCVVG
jgi:hypothetical protein